MSSKYQGKKCQKVVESIEKSRFSDRFVRLNGDSDEKFWVVNLTRWEMRVIQTDSGCWDWKGSYHRQGYGMFRVEKVGYPAKSGNTNAQRVAMALKLGRALEREERVTCTCGKLDCVNPDHLVLVDYDEQCKVNQKYDVEFFRANLHSLLKTPLGIQKDLNVGPGVALAMRRAFERYLERNL